MILDQVSSPAAIFTDTDTGYDAGQPAPLGPFRSTRLGWQAVLDALLPADRAVGLEDVQAIAPSAAAELIRPLFDADFYTAAYPDIRSGGQDPLTHYRHSGWREGRDPNAGFSTNFYLADNPDVARALVNPLLHYALVGEAEGRPKNPAEKAAFAASCHRRPCAKVDRLVRALFDPAYYLSKYPDIAASGVDPLAHYCSRGWLEGRDPSPGFDTAYYLRTNPDAALQGVNPLHHYAATGLCRSRPTMDRTADIVAVLRNRKSAEERVQDYTPVSKVSVLNANLLADLLGTLTRDATSMILSVSHDDYRATVGGVQLFIGREEAQFQSAGVCYLHLSPLVARLRLAGDDDGVAYLRLIANGTTVGYVDPDVLIDVLRAFGPRRPVVTAFICHCVLGHNVDDLITLFSALDPEQAVFWLHDYSSRCEGYNLLRNDVSFCDAPPPDSQACRICVHGETRSAHLHAMGRLFSAIPFDVVAPSQAALSVWRKHQSLPFLSARVQKLAIVDYQGTRLHLGSRAGLPNGTTGVTHVAMVGHVGAAHKGWNAFKALHRACGTQGAYRFTIFSADQHTGIPDDVLHVPVDVSQQGPDAMRDALERHEIDLVLLLSPWPETFSYAAHEALASGTDIVTLRDSGNIAAEVLRTGRGVVVDDVDELVGFFTSKLALDYVELARRSGNPFGRIVHCGTTASLLATSVDA